MASLSLIWSLTSDNDGIVYASNSGNNTISKLDKNGKVTEFVKFDKTPYGLAYSKAHNIMYVALGDGIVIIDLNDPTLSQEKVDPIDHEIEIYALAVDDINKKLYYSCKFVDVNGNSLYYIKYLELNEDGKNTQQFSFLSTENFNFAYMTYYNNNLYLSPISGINDTNYIFVRDLTGIGSNSSLFVGNHINKGLQFDNNGNLYVNYFVSGDEYNNGVYKIDANKNVTTAVRFDGIVQPTGITFANNKMYVGLAPNASANVNMILEVPSSTDITTLSAQTATLTGEVSKLRNDLSNFLTRPTKSQILGKLLDLSIAYLNKKC